MEKRKPVNRKFRITALILVLLGVLILAGASWAGYSASYAVDWHVLSGGGAPVESISGAVELNGTLGQSAIGISSTDQTNLGAGFWYARSMEDQLPLEKIYLPVTLRNY